MLLVPSSDDVSVAVHELAGSAGQPLLLLAHATGFHGRAYLPMAQQLAPPYHVLGMDLHGHGDTPRPPDWQVDWTHYGDDAEVVAEHLATTPGGDDGLIGFGHSMGGAALLMAAHRRSGRFRLLVLFEPIVYPPDREAEGRPNPLAPGARRRRPTFPSIDEAIANFASKPPFDAFDPAAVDAYVRYGFAPDPLGIRLKCDPQHEARTFELGGLHRTWDLLAEIETPVLVVAGHIEGWQPASIAEAVAAELPHGRVLLDDSLDHFGPFTHPARVADIVHTAAAELAIP